MTPYHLASTAIVLLIGVGILLRRHRRLHVPIMLTAFASDVALVLAVELRFRAIETVIGGTSPFVVFHAGISTLMLFAYGVVIWAGLGLLKGREDRRRIHRATAIVLVALRLTNYVTSFYV